MNKRVMKIFAIGIIIIMVFSSFVYYENVTEPQGINQVFAKGYVNYTNFNRCIEEGRFACLNSSNFSYKGNNVNLMTYIIPCPSTHYVNLSWFNLSSTGFGFAYSDMWIHSESMKYPYSNLVITVTNYSLSINKPLLKNMSAYSGDNFGGYAHLVEGFSNDYRPGYYFSVFGKTTNKINGKMVPDYPSLINPGNYTFYQNITFTITVTLGIMHFTSQTYSIDSSWWQVWGYNVPQMKPTINSTNP